MRLQGGGSGFALPIWVFAATALAVSGLAFAFRSPAEASGAKTRSADEEKQMLSPDAS